MGARNERRVGAVVYAKQAGFESVHGILDRLVRGRERENGQSLL